MKAIKIYFRVMNDAMPCVSNIYYKVLLSTDLACFNSAVEAIKHCKKKTFNSGDLYVFFFFCLYKLLTF